MIGPMDFTMNDESGIVIEGHEREPMIRQPWHPPYYQRLCEDAGLEKAVDLLMWELEIGDRPSVRPAIFTMAERARERYGLTLRHMTRRSLRSDLDLFAEVYNAAWDGQLGLRPLLQGGPRRLRARPPARLRPEVVPGRRDAPTATSPASRSRRSTSTRSCRR